MKRKTVIRNAAPLCVLLLVGALVPLGRAAVLTTGTLSAGTHTVSGDSVEIMDEHGALKRFVTTGWIVLPGETLASDFNPPMDAKPMMLTLWYSQDDVDSVLMIMPPGPVQDSWYTLPGTPTEAQVKFDTGYVDAIGESGRPQHVRAGLTVSPSIVGAGAVIRAERVAGTSCAFALYDVAGNRVRTLRTQISSGAATATWNGTDDFGRRLPEGIYYCCLDDPANATVRKLVLTN